MKRPDQKAVQDMVGIVARHQHFVQWVQTWCNAELAQLPLVVHNIQQAQGRCQVLREICDVLDKAPDMGVSTRNTGGS